MSYLQDKLASLYTDRADIAESIERLRTDPVTHANVEQAIRSEPPSTMFGRLMAATMPVSAKIKALEEERAWVEKQILALLGNPALGGSNGP